MDKKERRAEFVRRVHEARAEAGLSVQELAIRSGIAYRTLRNRLEGAPGRFSIDELDALGEATGFGLTYMLTGQRDTQQAA